MADNKFDKFTERARKVLTLAQEEAQRFNHNYIGTEHLLLGLVREGDGVAARVLSNMGVQLPKVRSAVVFIIGRGDQAPTGDIGLTPRAKKVIELAVDEARRLNHHYIGTEHLLLGLVREGEGIAAGVLESLGVNLEKVRAQVMQVVNQSSSSYNVGNPEFKSGAPGDLHDTPMKRSNHFTPRARRSLLLAEQEAKRFNHRFIGTDHLLLGLIREWDGVAARLLWEKGVRLVDARQAVELRNPRRDEAIGDERYRKNGYEIYFRKGDDLCLGPRANKVLKLAVDQVIRLNRRSIGTEHLLLGLIRAENGKARLIVADLGIDSMDMRSRLIRVIDRSSNTEDASTFVSQIWESLEGFDRFTARTKSVLALAESDAKRFFRNSVGTGQILLGIVKDEDCIAAQILVNLGSPPPRVRSAVEFVIGRGKPALPGKPGPTIRARAALTFAADEARRFNQGNIDTQHVLLGLIRDEEGIAAHVLNRLGITLEAARVEVWRMIE